jgi:molybdopterin synthase sulfur carrier subunit
MVIQLPATLSMDGKPAQIDIDAAGGRTLRSVLDGIEDQAPGATKKIMDSNGQLYRYVNLYVNGEDVRHGSGMSTQVKEGDEVLILPAISGG